MKEPGKRPLKVALIGNPNVGKSVIFGSLTGRYVSVSNYPGTTVEIARGCTSIDGHNVTVIDTPGINTLIPTSEDEEVTRRILMQGVVDAAVVVADAKNLRRALLICLQLGEMRIPFLLDLNMEDEAEDLGVTIDKERLVSLLGVPVVGTVAIRKKGLGELKKLLLSLIPEDRSPSSPPAGAEKWQKIDRILGEVMEKKPRAKRDGLDRLGELCTHPVWGLAVLAAVLFLFYEFVGKFGAQTAVGWLEEGLFGRVINPGAVRIFSSLFSFSPFLKDLFVGPFGLITMAMTYALAIIFPIVLTFFIAFSVMEDSGYLPRLAIMLNRIFRVMGLNGKAVIPMVLGLGCDTMATMSARVMETKKERVILTLLLALGVPCSAQLGIVLAMLSALPGWAMLLWSGVVIGTILVVGFLAARILPGQRADFVMEVPPLRRPLLGNIVQKTLARLEWYLKEVIPLFLIATFSLFLLDRSGALPRIRDFANPMVVGLLDLPPEATDAFLTGFLRRDYGATRFFDLFGRGMIDATQTTVSLIVMTLFVPCLANLLMIVKERGLKIATAIVAFIYPFSFFVGGVVNWGLRL